jgi:hypothetical protein
VAGLHFSLKVVRTGLLSSYRRFRTSDTTVLAS